jgi:hypothetical protein
MKKEREREKEEKEREREKGATMGPLLELSQQRPEQLTTAQLAPWPSARPAVHRRLGP